MKVMEEGRRLYPMGHIHIMDKGTATPNTSWQPLCAVRSQLRREGEPVATGFDI